jgi:chemotaxis protein methyltransferase CheR
VIEKGAATTPATSDLESALLTGQELYTIAIVIDQMPTLAGWDVTLHGSDLSTEALDKARAGVYSGLEVNRGLPVPLLVRYFDREGLSYRANERLRRMVTWVAGQPHRAVADDLPVGRRVRTQRAHLLRRTHQASGPRSRPAGDRTGGIPHLGGAETTLGLVDCFAPVQVGATTVYRAEAP